MNLETLQQDLEHVLEKHDIPYEYSVLLIENLTKNGLTHHLREEEERQ